jgi:hypothetical protein
MTCSNRAAANTSCRRAPSASSTAPGATVACHQRSMSPAATVSRDATRAIPYGAFTATTG